MVPGAEGEQPREDELEECRLPNVGSTLLEEGVVAACGTAEQALGLPRRELVCNCWAVGGTPAAQAQSRKATAAASQLHGHTGSGGPWWQPCWWQAAPAWPGVQVCRRGGGINAAGLEHMVSQLRGPCHWEDLKNKCLDGAGRGLQHSVSVERIPGG